MYLMGWFSGLTDLFAIVILVVSLIRYDYCLVITYLVVNLFETFSLIVVLGYYLQTDMGKNVPKQPGQEENNEEEGKEEGAKAHSMNTLKHTK